MTKQISILGAGWLGSRLGRKLIKRGYKVRGSTTNEDKKEALRGQEITPHLIDLDDLDNAENLKEFLAADTLVINIPPRIKTYGEEYHPGLIKKLVEHFREGAPGQIIYVSSTSVYPEHGRKMHERDVTSEDYTANPALINAENHLLGRVSPPTSIVRSGGIAGDDRIPGKKAAEKQTPVVPNQPVNLVHHEDLNEIISILIDSPKPGEVFNACSPEHPLRINVYESNRKAFGFPHPNYQFTNEPPPFKIISPRRAELILNYKFKYPDPEFYFSQ